MSVTAYKFLGEGAVGDYGLLAWPPAGEWVEAWVHGCRVEMLASWIDDELWEVELGAPVSETSGVLLSGRARLVRRIAGWDPETAQAFTESCLESIRAAAATSPGPEADAFVADADELALGGRPERYGIRPPASLAPSRGAIAANLGFVAAHAVACLSPEYDAGFAGERERQRAWLLGRVGLEV